MKAKIDKALKLVNKAANAMAFTEDIAPYAKTREKDNERNWQAECMEAKYHINQTRAALGAAESKFNDNKLKGGK